MADVVMHSPIARIPDSHRDLFDRPLIVSLGTINPDGSPQVMPMWILLDEDGLSINTAERRQKYWNMLRRPEVSILAIDPDNPQRFIEVRGNARLSAEDPIEQSARLHTLYLGPDAKPNVGPGEVRVVFRIVPTRIIVNG